MIEPTDKLSVTLEAQAWEVVMRAMAKAPYEVVAPLIADIQQQCTKSAPPSLALVPRDQSAE